VLVGVKAKRRFAMVNTGNMAGGATKVISRGPVIAAVLTAAWRAQRQNLSTFDFPSARLLRCMSRATLTAWGGGAIIRRVSGMGTRVKPRCPLTVAVSFLSLVT